MRRFAIAGVVSLCMVCGVMPGVFARAHATDRPPVPRERPKPVPIPSARPDSVRPDIARPDGAEPATGVSGTAVPVPQARPASPDPTGSDEAEKPVVPVFAEDAISPACPVLEEGRVSGRPLEPIVDEKGCVVPAVYAISAVGVERAVTLTPEAELTCELADRLDRFVAETVEPLAADMLGSPLTGLAVAGSYVCRTRNNQPGARPSEHGKANAIDIAAFLLADGRRISIADNWTLPPDGAGVEDPSDETGHDSEGGDGDGAIPVPVAKPVDAGPDNALENQTDKRGDKPVENAGKNPVDGSGQNPVENGGQGTVETSVDEAGKTPGAASPDPAETAPEEQFLRAVHAAACGPFTTVIGPDGDVHHRDHFHFDLVRRGTSGTSTFCQ